MLSAIKSVNFKNSYPSKINFGSTNFASFNITNPELWAKYVKAGHLDSSGLEYAAKWANMMEQGLSNGAKLRDIAALTSQAAAYERMSGSTHQFAVNVLSKVWKHGEHLKMLDRTHIV